MKKTEGVDGVNTFFYGHGAKLHNVLEISRKMALNTLKP